MIDKNIKNLVSLWETASLSFRAFYETPAFDYCEIKGSDWPNRLWFKQDINDSIVALAKERIVSRSAKLIVPYWDIYGSKPCELLEQSGFKKRFEQIGMSLRLDQTFSLRGDLNIELIFGEAGAKLWAELYPKAFGYRISPEILLKTFENINYYLASANGQPVGTAILFNTDGIAGIHGVGVIPEMRGKGFASEMMKFILNKAIDLNVGYAVLQASNMGKNVYLNLDFVEQFVIKNYVFDSN